MGETETRDFPDPLTQILAEHEAHKELCDLLEKIADQLPGDVDQNCARDAVHSLKHELPLHHRIEEEALFPILMKYADREDNFGEIVTRLNEEHVVDESFGDELLEFLEQLAEGSPLEDVNMFSYMLRGFFENYRRHILWENSVVLPLARRRLPVDGLRELASLIAQLKADCSGQSTQSATRALELAQGTNLCSGDCKECKNKSG